jgi:hypothetical protein
MKNGWLATKDRSRGILIKLILGMTIGKQNTIVVNKKPIIPIVDNKLFRTINLTPQPISETIENKAINASKKIEIHLK